MASAGVGERASQERFPAAVSLGECTNEPVRSADESLRRDIMRRCIFRCFVVAAASLLLGIPLWGQAGATTDTISASEDSDGQTHLGYPQDWSSLHLLMPGARTDDVLAAGVLDPRQVYNLVMGQLALENKRIGVMRNSRRMKIDWAVLLENRHVPQNQLPAQYRIDFNWERFS